MDPDPKTSPSQRAKLPNRLQAIDEQCSLKSFDTAVAPEPTSPGSRRRRRSMSEGARDTRRSSIRALRNIGVTSGLTISCMSPSCPGPKGWIGKGWVSQRCYSSTCPYRHRHNLWQHPEVRKSVARAQIWWRLRLTSDIEPYSSFVPRHLHSHILKLSHQTSSELENESPFAQVFDGAVLFADASGFTKLTEELARRIGPQDGHHSAIFAANETNGAEKLCKILDDFFSKLVGTIESFGGDIIKFAGDAVLVTWTVDNQAHSPKTLRDAVLIAAECALAIQQAMNNYDVMYSETEKTTLTLHMGIGAGRLTGLHVGGVFDRWEYIMSGNPLCQIGIAEPLALPRETVVSPEAWGIIGDAAIGTSVFELTELAREQGVPRKIEALEEHEHYMRLETLVEHAEHSVTNKRNKLTSRHAALLKRYIPAAVQPKLNAGHNGHLAEIRPVC